MRRMCDLTTVRTGWDRRPDSDRIRRWDDPVGRDDRGRRVAARWAWLKPGREALWNGASDQHVALCTPALNAGAREREAS